MQMPIQVFRRIFVPVIVMSTVAGALAIFWGDTNATPQRIGAKKDSTFIAAATKPGDINNPEAAKSTISLFLQTVRQGRIAEAYQKYCSIEFRKSTPLKEFETMLKRHSTLSRNNGMQILDTEHFENFGTVYTLLVGMDQTDNLVEFDIVYEVREWRILGIQVYVTPRQYKKYLPR